MPVDKIQSGKRTISIENVSKAIETEGPYGFAISCEEQYHNKIINAVYNISQGIESGKRIILLAGPSGSGKTTTANRIRAQLENFNIPAIRISMDDYFLSLSDRRLDIKSFEDPACIDWDLLMRQLESLLDGKTVRMPKYNFVRGISESGDVISVPKDGIIVCEGIHALNSDIFDKFKGDCKGIYVAPRTRVESNGYVLSPQELRMLRRVLRDSRTRGRDINQIIELTKSVDDGEKDYIEPFKAKASIHIDSFLDYELCILASAIIKGGYLNNLKNQYAWVDFLNSVPRNIPEKCIPQNSVLREFVG